MSKTVLAEQIGLGGAGSKGKFLVSALTLVPHVVVEHFGAKYFDILKYVHVMCRFHKHVASLGGKSVKLVQNFCPLEAN